jgi:hypothetical protein
MRRNDADSGRMDADKIIQARNERRATFPHIDTKSNIQGDAEPLIINHLWVYISVATVALQLLFGFWAAHC